MKHLSINNLFYLLTRSNRSTSVRVIFCHTELVEVDRKSYREQVHGLKSRFSIQVFLISIVKLTRIDEILYNITETSA